MLGFLLIPALATAAFFSKEQVGAFSKQGLKPFAVGAIGEVAIAAFTLGLVLAAQRNFGW
jgi:hypothetical protein